MAGTAYCHSGGLDGVRRTSWSPATGGTPRPAAQRPNPRRSRAAFQAVKRRYCRAWNGAERQLAGEAATLRPPRIKRPAATPVRASSRRSPGHRRFARVECAGSEQSPDGSRHRRRCRRCARERARRESSSRPRAPLHVGAELDRLVKPRPVELVATSLCWCSWRAGLGSGRWSATPPPALGRCPGLGLARSRPGIADAGRASLEVSGASNGQLQSRDRCAPGHPRLRRSHREDEHHEIRDRAQR
jgi:hypothetical protein